MAYNDRKNDDRKPTFSLGEFSGTGNMVDDPKEIGSGDRPFVSFKVAFNSRNYKEYEGSFFVGCTVSGLTAERVLADGRKGKKVLVKGELFADEPWENKDGDLVQSFSMNVREVAESWKFPERDGNGGGGGSRRSSRDDDDEPRGRSGRSSSRRSDDEDDEPRGRSGRSSRSSRDEEDEPRGRSRRSSRDDADEPRGRTRRSRGAVEDNGDSVDD